MRHSDRSAFLVACLDESDLADIAAARLKRQVEDVAAVLSIELRHKCGLDLESKRALDIARNILQVLQGDDE